LLIFQEFITLINNLHLLILLTNFLFHYININNININININNNLSKYIIDTRIHKIDYIILNFKIILKLLTDTLYMYIALRSL